LRHALALVAAGGFSIGLLAFFSDRVLFQPMPGVDLDPAALGIEAESLFLEAEDGVRVHAWFLPGASAAAPRALLFLHGNAGNASQRLPNAALLARLGWDVLLLDYRGYGLSEGRPSERGVVADARAALAHLTGVRGLPESRIALFGRSLGGAVAVELAAGRGLAGVVLESTFTSLEDMARQLVGPLGRLVSGFESIGRIPELRAPLLVLHGDRDEIVPIALGRALFEAAPEPKRFVVIGGAGHNDTVAVGGRDYLRRIGDFLDEVCCAG